VSLEARIWEYFRGKAASVGRLDSGEFALTDEDRVASRRRVLKIGAIEFGGTTVPCAVRNLSASGAALEITSPLWFPDQFTLAVESEGLRKPCRIVWRREKRIGVTFTEN
jgi:hypothetical protein